MRDTYAACSPTNIEDGRVSDTYGKTFEDLYGCPGILTHWASPTVLMCFTMANSRMLPWQQRSRSDRISPDLSSVGCGAAQRIPGRCAGCWRWPPT